MGFSKGEPETRAKNTWLWKKWGGGGDEEEKDLGGEGEGVGKETVSQPRLQIVQIGGTKKL